MASSNWGEWFRDLLKSLLMLVVGAALSASVLDRMADRRSRNEYLWKELHAANARLVVEADAAMSRYWEKAYVVFKDAERLRGTPGGRDSLVVEPQFRNAFDFALLRIEKAFTATGSPDTELVNYCDRARAAEQRATRLLNWEHLSTRGDDAATARAEALDALLQSSRQLIALLEDRLYQQIELESRQ